MHELFDSYGDDDAGLLDEEVCTEGRHPRAHDILSGANDNDDYELPDAA